MIDDKPVIRVTVVDFDIPFMSMLKPMLYMAVVLVFVFNILFAILAWAILASPRTAPSASAALAPLALLLLAAVACAVEVEPTATPNNLERLNSHAGGIERLLANNPRMADCEVKALSYRDEEAVTEWVLLQEEEGFAQYVHPEVSLRYGTEVVMAYMWEDTHGFVLSTCRVQ